MKRFFGLLVMSLMFITSMKSENIDLLEIADILKEVESNNNPHAVGDGGNALGVLQIHEACIIDVNRYYGTEYTHADAKDIKIAEDIFVKYISIGIKVYIKRCGYPPSEYQIVRMWNGGYPRGYEYSSTLPYLAKYLKYKNQLNEQITVMSKFLKRQEAVAKFKLDFLPQIRQAHGNNEAEFIKGWDYFKGALYKASMVNDAALNWQYPKNEIG